MHKGLSVIIILFFLQSCAHFRGQNFSPGPSDYVSRMSLGIYVIQDSQDNLVVSYVPEEGPGSETGIQRGDILKSMNGRPLSDRQCLLKETNKYYENDTVALLLDRGNRELKVRAKVRRSFIRKDIHALFQKLAEGKEVRLAIIVDEINNVFIQDPQSLKEWKSSVRIELLTYLENEYLHAFQYDPGFTLIDRERISEVLGEIHFGLSGYVSSEKREEIGRILGATHILFIQFSRVASLGSSHEDIQTLRLVEVATDKVLASLSISQEGK